MPETHNSAAEIGLPNSHDCPVAALARAVKFVIDAEELLEAHAKQVEGPAYLENQKMRSALEEELGQIEAQASQLAASSGLGAIFQIGLISMNADSITSWVPEGSKSAGLCLAMKKNIERMCYSLLSFIETTTGAKAEDAASSYYMPRDENPHLGKAVFDANGLTKSENPDRTSDDAAREDEAARALDSTIEIDEEFSVRDLSDAIQISEAFLNRVSAARFGVTDEEGNALMMLINVASMLLRKTPARRPADIAGKIALVRNSLRGFPLFQEMLQSAIDDCAALEAYAQNSVNDAETGCVSGPASAAA